jgi:hypothetical protein
MRHVETLPGMRGGGIKENGGRGKYDYYILEELL